MKPLSLLALVSLGAAPLPPVASQAGVEAEVREEPNREVPYVPTPDRVVERMLEMARVGRGDLVYDLGCGDGRIVVAAARRGARGVGIDLDPDRIAESRANAARAGVHRRVELRQQDLFATDLTGATVVMLYLLPDVNLKLRPRLLEQLAPGARIVSHDFDMADWEPDRSATVGTHRVFLWTVPAKVAGIWTLRRAGAPDEYRLELVQTFQTLRGVLTGAGESQALEGRVNGNRVALTSAAGRKLEGRLEGDRLTLRQDDGSPELVGGREVGASGRPR